MPLANPPTSDSADAVLSLSADTVNHQATVAPADALLAGLHHMSVTAGTGAERYAAVNGAAVVTALLGLAGWLALMGNVLLLLPLAGVVVGVIALRQIGDSNGTQTGKGLALLGLASCVVCAAGVIGYDLLEHARARHDEQAIASLINQLQDDVAADRYESAYQLFDADFRDRVSLEMFAKGWKYMQSDTQAGRIVTMRWNGVTPLYDVVEAGTITVARVKAILEFAKATAGNEGEGRFNFVFQKANGVKDSRWQIVNFPYLFAEERFPSKDAKTPPVGKPGRGGVTR